jgi:uncharacterized protein (DUF2336 family)
MASVPVIDELERALRSGLTPKRAEVLRRVTDLFLGQPDVYSQDQVAVFDDVMRRLVDHIEERARIELSVRLAGVANAPPGVIRQLAWDDSIDVAGPVLECSVRLDDDALVELAKNKGPEHLSIIASRPSLNEAVTDVLVDRGDSAVAMQLAANPGAALSNSGYQKLLMWADGDDQLTTMLGSRPDIPHHLFRQLLSRATEVVRARLIELAEPSRQNEIKLILADIAAQISRAMTPRRYAEAKLLVRSFSQDTSLTRRKLSEFANAQRISETVAALSVLSGVRIDLVDRLLHSETHYGVLILCKAIGLAWSAAYSVMEAGRKAAQAAPLATEVVYEEFQHLMAPSAQRLLRFWLVRQTAAVPDLGN